MVVVPLSVGNGNGRSVPLRNSDPVEILKQMMLLRSSAGRKTALQVKKRTVTGKPSVQGRWSQDVQKALHRTEG